MRWNMFLSFYASFDFDFEVSFNQQEIPSETLKFNNTNITDY